MTDNKTVVKWLNEVKELVCPDKVVWIDGSEEQLEELRREAVQSGEMIKLNEEKLPGCYLHRTLPNDVARVEDRTFICSRTKENHFSSVIIFRQTSLYSNRTFLAIKSGANFRMTGRIISSKSYSRNT